MSGETIWDLKGDPWGDRPRYYPPGCHPATARMRAHLRVLEAFGFGNHECAVYIRDQLASFEQGESDCKARDDLRLSS